MINCLMAATIPAPVNPALLVWAREQAGYAPEPAAVKLHVRPERLISWERGDRRPTLNQARKLAKLYQRPFGTFFLPAPPEVPPLASEYRRLPGVVPGVESPELRLAIRVMSLRREAALELLEQHGQPAAEFTLEARLSESPAEVGERLRQWLGVSVDAQFNWQDEWQAWRTWREAAESTGVLVFQFPKVPLEQARGLSLLEFPLPAVGINSKEVSPGARSYSLLHELAHLALARANEERVAQNELRTSEEWAAVERFAEEVASAAIIPERELTDLLSRFARPVADWTVEAVRTLARKFRVTPLAMATRLRAHGEMSWSDYTDWKEQWAEAVAAMPPRKGGFATPIGKTLGRGGEPFAKLVLSGLDNNWITPLDASRLLDLGFGHFEKLREALRPGPGSAAQAESE